jgi:hypothetical protein
MTRQAATSDEILVLSKVEAPLDYDPRLTSEIISGARRHEAMTTYFRAWPAVRSRVGSRPGI